MSTARQLAIASENAAIDASVQRAVEAKARPSALGAMAQRLQISEKGLMNTLKSTVFSKASDNEFMALVVVCNEYGLNPMLKEIYAFPAKGGGIVPMVSVDGWIRIMNSHPMFDGIEFDYINDAAGKTIAIEAIIHRKDRNRPIKVMEYLAECQGQTEPWKKSPFRMLRHRALIQCARVAFGFSGIVAEGDEGEYIEGQIIDRQVSLPASRPSIAEELDDEIVDHQTGEVQRRDTRGMTEVDEETARELDQGRADADHGDQHDGSDGAPMPLNDAVQHMLAAQTVIDLNARYNTYKDMFADDALIILSDERADREKQLRAKR